MPADRENMPSHTVDSFFHRGQDVFHVLRHLDFEREPWRRRRIDVREVLAACLPPPGGPDLSTAKGRRTMTQAVWSSNDVVSGRPLRSSPTLAMAVRVALAIDDVRAGRWHLVPSEYFVRLLEDTGLRVAPDRPTLPIEDVVPSTEREGTHPVEFAFPWRPSPVGTGQALGTATALACVTNVDAVEAPVVCSLWTPEGRFDVRRHGATWLRPVLSPESWQPITLDHFRTAAASGVAWRDSPFLPHTGRNRPTFHLSDYASPRRLAKGDESRIARARDLCLARAGWLCVVDGIVHRTTQEPLAGMAVMLVDGELEVVPVWALGTLDSMCSMDTLEALEGSDAMCARAEMDVAPFDRRGFVPVADWAATVGLLPETWPWHHQGVVNRPSAHELVRSGWEQASVRDGDAVLRAATELSKRALSCSRTWATVGTLRVELRHLVDGLDILKGERVDPRVRRCVLSGMGPLCDRLSGALRGSTDFMGPVWEYVVALVTHAIHCEVVEGSDEDLAGLRL